MARNSKENCPFIEEDCKVRDCSTCSLRDLPPPGSDEDDGKISKSERITIWFIIGIVVFIVINAAFMLIRMKIS